jgi:tetratricopeptide (TPR) repeat protein
VADFVTAEKLYQTALRICAARESIGSPVRPSVVCWLLECCAKLYMRMGKGHSAANLWAQRVTLGVHHGLPSVEAELLRAASLESIKEYQEAEKCYLNILSWTSKAPSPAEQNSGNGPAPSSEGTPSSESTSTNGATTSTRTMSNPNPAFAFTREQQFDAILKYGWLCRHAFHNYAKAADLYALALILEPQNPHILVQMAWCKMQAPTADLKEIEQLYDRAALALEMSKMDDTPITLTTGRTIYDRPMGKEQAGNGEAEPEFEVVQVDEDGTTTKGSADGKDVPKSETDGEQAKKNARKHQETPQATTVLARSTIWDECFVYGECAVFHHDKTKQTEKANALYLKALSSSRPSENYSQVAANYAVLLHHSLGKTEEARFWFERALAIKPFLSASTLYVSFLTSIGENDKAIAHLQEMTTKFPSEAPLIFHKIAKVQDASLAPVGGEIAEGPDQIVSAGVAYATPSPSTAAESATPKPEVEKPNTATEEAPSKESNTTGVGSLPTATVVQQPSTPTPSQSDVLERLPQQHQETLLMYCRALGLNKRYQKVTAPTLLRLLEETPASNQVAQDVLIFLTQKACAFRLAEHAYEIVLSKLVSPTMVVAYARLLFEQRRKPNKALNVLKQGLKILPANAILLDHYADMIAHVYPERKDFAETIHLRSINAPQNKNSPLPYFYYAAFLCYTIRSPNRAFVMYQKALSLTRQQPGEDHIHNCFAVFLESCVTNNSWMTLPGFQGADITLVKQLAIHHHEMALKIEPRKTNLRNALGNCLWRFGYYEEAWKVFSDGLNAEPENVVLLRSAAAFLTERCCKAKDERTSGLNSSMGLDLHRGTQIARQLFLNAINIDANDLVTLGNYAVFLEELAGEPEKANKIRDEVRHLSQQHVAAAAPTSLSSDSAPQNDIDKDDEE